MGKNVYAMYFEKIPQAVGLYLNVFWGILQNLEKAILPNSACKDV